jgi:hypothetical protein
MRSRFVVIILFVTALTLGAIFLLRPHPTPSSPNIVNPVVATASPAPPEPASRPVVIQKELTPAERQAAIDAERDRLYTWQMSNDPQSLSNILGDLINPEKEIREAAIDATKEFGSTNAIPVLKALAAESQDNDEAIAMLEAVKFLSTEPIDLTQLKAGPLTPEEQQHRAAARQAREQARAQKHPSLMPAQNGQP